jgi:hypothetical protein
MPSPEGDDDMTTSMTNHGGSRSDPRRAEALRILTLFAVLTGLLVLTVASGEGHLRGRRLAPRSHAHLMHRA